MSGHSSRPPNDRRGMIGHGTQNLITVPICTGCVCPNPPVLAYAAMCFGLVGAFLRFATGSWPASTACPIMPKAYISSITSSIWLQYFLLGAAMFALVRLQWCSAPLFSCAG